jgi:hypothetical protein
VTKTCLPIPFSYRFTASLFSRLFSPNFSFPLCNHFQLSTHLTIALLNLKATIPHSSATDCPIAGRVPHRRPSVPSSNDSRATLDRSWAASSNPSQETTQQQRRIGKSGIRMTVFRQITWTKLLGSFGFKFLNLRSGDLTLILPGFSHKKEMHFCRFFQNF